MSPPVPAAPTRRPSSATFFSTSAPQLGFGFNSRSSPASRVFSGDFAGFSLTAASVGAGAGGRRVSTPGHFFSGGNGGGLGSGGVGNPWRNSSPMRLSPHAAPVGLAVETGRRSHSPGAPVSPHSLPKAPSSTASPARTVKEDEAHVVQKLGTYAIAEETSSGQESPLAVEGEVHEPAGDAEDEVDEVDEEEEDQMVDETVHERIERELNELEAEARTGVRFLIALQGMRLVF
ncbi:uncharacterized protein RHOBADRAFT_55482 [Rhodotorula graminis WP1]|uniref:Uncharacterized protein n=1 Tax=Rhodotorula graminis (strain WP1) TaxID=578459 RepID=A0A0P9EZZ8_RHOGW|nr:uncharacterized protein RHOBADRAFT_55482 [Rhodotorula graminis WP1]KPV72801.1 hypothetical protein RHOBADRAFT_55482 [Rhodotorula graminis WP1]